MPYEPTRKPNCTPASMQHANVPERRPEVPDLFRPPLGCRGAPHHARFSSGVSQRASSGRSGSSRSSTMPTTTTGRPSDDEQPLPAGKPERAVQAQQYARHRTADHRRDRNRHHEPRDDARAVLRREPGREDRTRCRERTRLRRRQAGSAASRSCWARPPGHGRRNQPPTDHDARQIQRRAPTR